MQQLLLITSSVCLIKALQCYVLLMRCVLMSTSGHSCVVVYVYAFVFMLQWGVKLIWEPEPLNLLLKLVFDRKLISKARQEEVEKGEKRRRGKKWKWDLCLLRQWLDSALTFLFRLNLFPQDEPWNLHPGNSFFGEEPTKKPFSTLWSQILTECSEIVQKKMQN